MTLMLWDIAGQDDFQTVQPSQLRGMAGYLLVADGTRRATLEMVTRDLFPGGDLRQADFWTGLRPMTPDGTPIIGGTRYPNLFLNTGHGTLGWTMACGSGKLISDIVTGRTPEINPSGLALERYETSRTRPVAVRPVTA